MRYTDSIMSDASVQQGPSKISSLLLLASAFVLPLFFLPGVVDPGNWQKRIAIGVVALALVALWIVQTLLSRRTFITITRSSLLLLGFAAVTMLSAALTNNAMYHLTNFPVTWLMFAVLVLFGSTMARTLRWGTVLKVLLIPASILTVIALLQLTPLALSEVINKIVGTAYPKTISFSPADSLLGMLTFVIPVALASLLHTAEPDHNEHESSMVYKAWSGFLLLSSVGLGIFGWSNLATRPFILPWSAGWTIAVETLKNPLTLLLGFGPNSFLNAFHQFRGLAFNNLDFWSIRFATSSSELLFILTTGGLVALGALLLSAKFSLPMLRSLRSRHFSLVVYMALHALAFVALPYSPLMWFTLCLGLIMTIREAARVRSEQHEVWELEFPTSARSPWITPVVTSVVVGGLLAAVTIYMIAPLRSNYLLGWSLKQSTTGTAESIYNAQVQAMNLTPFHPEYRRAVASTSFAIIQALGTQAQQNNTELTAEQQQLSLNLLQQSINEARNAVSLDPYSTESWELLANIYSNVLTVEGAPDWAVAARTQAIQTDPTNPELRVALGQLYAQLSEPESALNFYEQAIQLHPRWVQPYYLFGETALVLENGQAAAIAFQRTLELLDATSQERPVVEDKLRTAIELAERQAAEASAAAAAADAQQGQGAQGGQASGQAQGQAGQGQPQPQAQNQNEVGVLDVPTEPSQPENPEVNPEPEGFGELLE